MPYVIYVVQKPPYTFIKFLGDAFMTCLTGGLWLIWVIVRSLSRR